VLQCVVVCCGVSPWRVCCRQGALSCMRVAVCCSVLQCVAVCCSVLQYVAVCCNVVQCVAVCCSVLQCVAVFCSVLQCVAVCHLSQCVADKALWVACESLCVAVCCILLQYVAVCNLGECVAGKALCVAGEALAVVAALTASAEGKTKHQQTSKETYKTSKYVKRDLYTSKETY